MWWGKIPDTCWPRSNLKQYRLVETLLGERRPMASPWAWQLTYWAPSSRSLCISGLRFYYLQSGNDTRVHSISKGYYDSYSILLLLFFPEHVLLPILRLETPSQGFQGQIFLIRRADDPMIRWFKISYLEGWKKARLGDIKMGSRDQDQWEFESLLFSCKKIKFLAQTWYYNRLSLREMAGHWEKNELISTKTLWNLITPCNWKELLLFSCPC